MKRTVTSFISCVLAVSFILFSLPVSNLLADSTVYPDIPFYEDLESAKCAWEQYIIDFDSDSFEFAYDIEDTSLVNEFVQYVRAQDDDFERRNYYSLNEYIIYSGGYTIGREGQIIDGVATIHNYVLRLDVQLDRHGSSEEINEYVGIASVIANSLNADSDYDRVVAIARWISDNAAYDNSLTMFSLKNCISDRSCVCEGYAQCFQAMATSVGLNSYIVKGQLNGVNHAWNVVEIDDSWYYVDTTNADRGSYFDDSLILFGTEYSLNSSVGVYNCNTDIDVSSVSYRNTDNSESDTSRFVNRLYASVLDRQVDSSGYDYWCGVLDNSRLTYSDVAKYFFFSSEFVGRQYSNEVFVTKLYEVLFDRQPDAGGYNYWVNYLENGNNRINVFNHFINSIEWKVIYEN